MNARTLRQLALDPQWVPSGAERVAIARLFAAGESLVNLEGVIAAMPQAVWRGHVLDILKSLDSEVRYWRVAAFFEHLSAAERCAALLASKPKAKFIAEEAKELVELEAEQVMEIAARQPEVAARHYAPFLTLARAETPAWVDGVWVDALSAPWPGTGYVDPDSLGLSEACLNRLGSSRSEHIVDEAVLAADGTFIRAHSLLQFASADAVASAWDVFMAANLHSELTKRLWRDAWQNVGRRYAAELIALMPTLKGAAHTLLIAEALGRLNRPIFAEANVALLGDTRKTVREVAKLNLLNLGVAAKPALQVATKARKKAIRVTAQELLEHVDSAEQVAEVNLDEVTSKHDVKTLEYWVDAYEQLGSPVWQVAAARFANEPQRFFRAPGAIARARPGDTELRSALFSTFCVIPRARNAYYIIEALVALDVARAPSFVERLASAPHRLELVRAVHEKKVGTQEVWRALLLSPDKSIRSIATENVEHTAELVATCAELLGTPDSARRVLGATLASSIQCEAARKLLAKFVSDADRSVRDIAALDAGQSAPEVSAAELLAPFASDESGAEWGTIRDVEGAELRASAVVAALRTEDGSFTSATLMRLVPLLDADDAAALSERLLDSYLENIGDISRRADLFQVGWVGRVSTLLRFGRTPEELQPYGFQIGKWLMATLWQLNTAEADAWLHYWTRHATAPSIQREAWRRLATRAEAHKVAPLAYMSRLDPFVAAVMPTQPSDVSIDTKAGEVKLSLVGGEVSIEVDGVRRRSLPKDATSARKLLKEFRSAARSAKKESAVQLEEAMVLGRRWTGTRFAAERGGCDLFRQATERLLCWFGDELGVAEDDRYVLADLETRKLAEETSVRIAHVAELDASTLQVWADYFADHELSQPFEQLARQSPRLDASATTPFDKLRRRAAKLAWRNFGAKESIGALDRCYWGYGVRAVISVGKASQKSCELSYTDLSGSPLPLEEVHPVAVHESHRDAALLFE
ncbi:MAG: DUF4132 domain-containing protein [Polyangiales bacterium]